MSIGAGIVLFVIGAILAFAVNVELDVINLTMVGYILMAGGVVVVLIGVILLMRRRSSVSRTTVDPVNGEQVTRRSSSTPTDDVL